MRIEIPIHELKPGTPACLFCIVDAHARTPVQDRASVYLVIGDAARHMSMSWQQYANPCRKHAIGFASGVVGLLLAISANEVAPKREEIAEIGRAVAKLECHLTDMFDKKEGAND